MTEAGVSVLAPVHPALLTWLRARARVHHHPDADRIDPACPPVAAAQVIVLRSNVTLGEPELARLPRLRLVLRAGSGTDNLDLAAMQARGVELIRVGGEPSARAVAELALQATLTLLRRVPVANAELAAGRWDKQSSLGGELAGSTVGVWGAGPVGRAVGELFDLVGASVRYAGHPSVPPGLPAEPPAELVASADVHVFALPLRPDTAGIVGPAMLAALAACRPYLVNMGRWALFDMPAVIQALSGGSLSGVAVDPVERAHTGQLGTWLAPAAGPVLNLQLTPHLGAMTSGAYRRVAEAAIAALQARWDSVWRARPDDGEALWPQ